MQPQDPETSALIHATNLPAEVLMEINTREAVCGLVFPPNAPGKSAGSLLEEEGCEQGRRL